jgi:hypothetical protein
MRNAFSNHFAQRNRMVFDLYLKIGTFQVLHTPSVMRAPEYVG